MTALLPLFLIGFTYSFYHCVGMCGGFVAAYTAACSAMEPGERETLRLPTGRSRLSCAAAIARQWPVHLLFNLGRVTSYTLIGAALGFAGSWANYYGPGTRLQGISGLVGGTLMILFGLSLVGLIRMPAGTLIGGSRVRGWFNALLRSRSPWRTYPMGLLVGTVPCGLVYSMSSYALASGNPLRGALDMAAFGLGTVPAMFCFGFVSGALSARARKGLLGIAVILTIVMGAEAIHRGIGALH